MSLIVNVDMLHCTTPLIFGACVDLVSQLLKQSDWAQIQDFK